jgi:DNA-binding response OmpR family regulator
MKILLVEDEKDLRETVKAFLVKEKFVVECAEDYPTAVRKISEYDYDCILLDIMLPGGSGLSVLAKLKKQRKQDSVIIISAKNSIEDKMEGLELGA